MDTDSFSAKMTETCPKGIRPIVCVNRRESAVKFPETLLYVLDSSNEPSTIGSSLRFCPRISDVTKAKERKIIEIIKV